MFARLIPLAATLLAVPPTALPAPPPGPNARALYGACVRYVAEVDAQRPDQPIPTGECWGYAMSASFIFEGPSGDARRRFCLPPGVLRAEDSIRTMAAAYIDYYDHIDPAPAHADGIAVFLAAMIAKWPCAG